MAKSKRSGFDSEHYSPKCAKCARKIKDHSPKATLAKELKLYWREFENPYTGATESGTVCYKCKNKIDAPKSMPGDSEYRAALAKHVLGRL